MPDSFASFAGRPLQDAALEYVQFASRTNPDQHALDLIAACNRYVCPRGVGPGHATILGLYPDVQAWQQASGFQPLILGSDQSQISAAQMVMLDSEQVVPGAQGDPAALYVCHLADIRYLMLRSTFTKAYNVRSLASPTAEYWANTENPIAQTLYNGNSGPGIGPWTWQTMLFDIFTQLPASLITAALNADITSVLNTVNSLEGFPSQNPERFRFIEESPLIAFVQALRSIFLDLVYSPVNGGTFSVVKLGAADANFTQLQNSLTGSLIDATFPQESNATWFPQSVDVVFLSLYTGTPEQPQTVSPYYVQSVTPASYPSGSIPFPGTKDTIFAPLDAQIPCGGIPASSPWTPSTAYTLGQRIHPTSANGHTYICTTAGLSGTTEPIWPTGVGSTIADSAAVWTEQTIYPVNNAAIQSLATVLANNYYAAKDQAMRPNVWVYTGIQGFFPGSLVGQVEWSLGIDGPKTIVSSVAD